MRASAVKDFLATTRRAPPPRTTCGTVSSVTFPSPHAKNASTHPRRASFAEGRAGAEAAAGDAGAVGFGAAGCPAAGDDASHPRAAASRAMTGSVARDFMGRRLTSFAAGLEPHEDVACGDGLPGRGLHRGDDAVPRRLHLVLHLHRLEDEKWLTLRDLFARRDEDAENAARHRPRGSPRAGSRSAARGGRGPALFRPVHRLEGGRDHRRRGDVLRRPLRYVRPAIEAVSYT